VYNNSAVKGTYVGLQKFGGKRCTPECKLLLIYCKLIFSICFSC
jgi:hypothetical protein